MGRRLSACRKKERSRSPTSQLPVDHMHGGIWVLGADGVDAGRRSLVAALGAKKPTCDGARIMYEWCPAPAIAPAKIVLAESAERVWRDAQRGDVFVLVFDLTNRTTFVETMALWKDVAKSVAQHHAVLVGTNLDLCGKAREVETSEAMETALVECDEYVEVAVTRAPFTGLSYLRQLLATWVAQNGSDHSTSPVMKPKRCIQTSVWLYDPTEEVHVERHDDVRIRPISRALFEMREAGGDRMKTLERRRDQSMTKLVTRSRYHGPTESSRSMRWQNHMQQQQSSIRQRRQSTPDVREAHTALETKSFMQTTKLMQQRMAELKQKIMTVATSSQSRPPKKLDEGRRRAKTVTAAPSPPKHLESTRTRAPSISPAKLRNSSPLMHPTLGIVEDSQFSDFSLELPLPRDDNLSILPAPVHLAHLTPPRPVDNNVDGDDDSKAVDALFKQSHVDKIPSPVVKDSEQTALSTKDESDDDENRPDKVDDFSTAIDDMLDYFDGITLPI